MKKTEFVRNPYNYDADKLSTETGLSCLDESRTEQQHVEEADINYIAERFMRTGELRTVVQMPTGGDFSGDFDFQSMMNLIKHANDEFMAMPAKMRTRFENDPAQLIAFLEDPENRDEAIRLGLIEKPAIITPPMTTGDTDGTQTKGSTPPTPQTKKGDTGTPGTPKPDAGTQKP